MRYFAIILLFVAASPFLHAQGSFSGGLELNSEFYQRDTSIGASNTPHYDNLLSSTDAWLNLDYRNYKHKLEAGIRLDVFNNSNLHDPGTPYTALGIGRFYLRKTFNNLTITGGYFYDQFGSGITFRSYQDRALGIDNATLGIHLEYDFLENWTVKAFTGMQKNRLKPFRTDISLYNPIIKGLNAEGSIKIGEDISLLPGGSVVNRTLDENSMNFIVNTIESYDEEDRFVPKYNTFAYSLYNRLNIGNVSWYIEGARKTSEAIYNADQKLVNRPGSVVYSTLTYSQRGFGAGLKLKRTDDFVFRTSPNEKLLDGMISYVPPVSKQNSLRLPARYVAATQELEELAGSGNITYTPKKGYTINATYSEVRAFDYEELFREIYVDLELNTSRKWKGLIGGQYIDYDQVFYEGKGASMVHALTPFLEFNYNIDRRKSIRMELQQQFSEQDYGDWVYGLLEFSIAPYFTVSVSDMYNYDPNPPTSTKKQHYYSFTTSFVYQRHRLSLSYTKQVEGVICTGGVCRYEPAFNGFKVRLTSSF